MAALDRPVAGERPERAGLLCPARPGTAQLLRLAARAAAARGRGAAAFVPVQVVADAVPAQASALEVVLADGRTVRVAPGFDAATLRQLLAVLEGRPC